MAENLRWQIAIFPSCAQLFFRRNGPLPVGPTPSAHSRGREYSNHFLSRDSSLLAKQNDDTLAPRLVVAEREGFEPSVGVNLHTLSRRAPSANSATSPYFVNNRFRKTVISLSCAQPANRRRQITMARSAAYTTCQPTKVIASCPHG